MVQQTMSALTTQLEHYFSPANMSKDIYLRSHMNVEGYVPVALLMAFPRISNLCTDRHLLHAAIHGSGLLELMGMGNGEGRQYYVRLRYGWQQWVVSPFLSSATSPMRGARVSPPLSPMHLSAGPTELTLA